MTATTKQDHYDVIVVGAGVAGGALSVCLARAGRRVLCIERDLQQPERIVGELLQPGGYNHLVELGLREALEGIDAQEVCGYGIFLDGKATPIRYEGGQMGRSFHNGRFVDRLRQLCAAEANLTLVQGNVLALDQDTESSDVLGVQYKADDGTIHRPRADLTVGCDGCFSRFRSKISPALSYSNTSQFAGLLLHDMQLPFSNHGHVVLCGTAPVLFYQVSSTETRCLVDVPGGAKTPPLPEYLEMTIAPQLPEALRGAFLAAVRAGTSLKSMPNRVMPAAPVSLRGAILLGDSFNMRHPLTGGGMTVALSDVSVLTRLLADLEDLSDHRAMQRLLCDFYAERRPLSGTINVLADALYQVFCATGEPALVEMRTACFEYLGRGGRCSSDPISMLGGLRPRPNLLAMHFFGVAFFGCAKLLLPLPTPGGVWTSARLVRAAFNIIKPLVDANGITFLRWIPFSGIAAGCS